MNMSRALFFLKILLMIFLAAYYYCVERRIKLDRGDSNIGNIE